MKTKFLGKEYNVSWWKGETLSSPIALDTETEVKPSYLVPKLSTCQVYDGGDHIYYIPSKRVIDFIKLHENHEFIMHNAAFDIRVLEQHTGYSFLEALDKEKIWDTNILYKLVHLAVVGFIPFKSNLALLSEKFLGIKLEKDDEVRLEFGQFIDREDLIPENFLTYGAKDVIATYKIYQHLKYEIAKTPSKTNLSHSIQIAADYTLKRIHENGIGFDLSARDIWIEDKNKRLKTLQNKLALYGWERGVKGVSERYEAAIRYLGLERYLPKTEDGSISSKSEDLEPFKHIEFINNYLEFVELEKATTFVRDVVSDRLHPRYNCIVNTGRTSCSKPNIQQLPKVGGIREMFIAKPGHTFLITDYAALELCTLSQILYDTYGNSVMGDLINSGEDLHTYYASILYDKDPKDITKSERQAAKPASFGFSGGLGIKTFIEFARGYNLDLDIDTAQKMKDKWFDAFPEMVDYLKNSEGVIMTTTGRIRGNTTFCAEKNTPFQGLAADGAKLALFYLQKANFNIVMFVHDEIVTEVPIEKAEELLKLQEKIMIDSLKKVTPDVRISVESQVTRCYTK